jgi:hypothetical protein
LVLDRNWIPGLALFHCTPSDPQRLFKAIGLAKVILTAFADDVVCASYTRSM